MGFERRYGPRASEYELKRGEEKLKSIMGGKLAKNQQFVRKMELNGIARKSQTWNMINSIIMDELKMGKLRSDDVEDRIDELVVRYSPNDHLVSENDVNTVAVNKAKDIILQNGNIAIHIPYQKSGVNDAIIGGAFLGKPGAIFGALNEGKVSWKASQLLFMDEGINVKSSGHAILYENVNKVMLGDKQWKYTIVTVITNSGENFVFRTETEDAKACKAIIEENRDRYSKKVVEKKSAVVNESGSVDDLVKLAELYEKGLLTKDEFDKKKSEILNGKSASPKAVVKNKPAKNTSATVKNNKPRFCSNCGSTIVEGNKFCTNCGFKLV